MNVQIRSVEKVRKVHYSASSEFFFFKAEVISLIITYMSAASTLCSHLTRRCHSTMHAYDSCMICLLSSTRSVCTLSGRSHMLWYSLGSMHLCQAKNQQLLH